MSDARTHVVVIGGGQAAKWLLFNFAEQLARGDRRLAHLRITILERGWEIGTGLAWSRHNALPEHQTSLAEPISRVRFGDEQQRQFHETIALLRQQGVVADLRRGIEVTELRREGRHLYVVTAEDELIRADAVVLATGHWDAPDPLHGTPGYHSSPWPAARLQQVVCPDDGAGAAPRDVLVLGTYLNALDAVISLALKIGSFSPGPSGRLQFHGPRGVRLTMASRRGRLPRIWGRAPALRPPVAVTPASLAALSAAAGAAGFLPLAGCIDLLEREIALACGAPFHLRDVPGRSARRIAPTNVTRAVRRVLERDLRSVFVPGTHVWRYEDTREVPWQAALYGALPVLSESYHGLSAEDQHEFDRNYRTMFFHHVMPMTLESAHKIAALFDSGHLEVLALGESYSCVPDAGGFVVSYGGPGSANTRRFTDVVRACTASSDLRHHPAQLFQLALRSGLVQPATRAFCYPSSAEIIAARHGVAAIIERHGVPRLAVGGIEIDPKTRRVIGARARPGEEDGLVFAMGPNLIGQFLDAHSIGQLIRDSACILSALADVYGSRTSG